MSKTRRNLLGRDPSGTHPCCLGLFAGRGAHSAGACCALCVKAEFRHRGQPGHHARTCPLNRQGTAAAAHPQACFSKWCSSTASRTSLQRPWGNQAHIQASTHTHTYTHTHTQTHIHTHTHTHARTYTHTNTNTRKYSQARTRTCTRRNTQTHAETHIQTPKHTGTHPHPHMHMHAHVACVMGFAKISASLATLPHLSFSTSTFALLLLRADKGDDLPTSKSVFLNLHFCSSFTHANTGDYLPTSKSKSVE